jgi:hypothetical protein
VLSDELEVAAMEPRLVTDPRLADVLEELKKREPIFHRPEFGTTRRDFENMTDPNFWEVGASGRRYSRQHVIDTLVERHAAAHGTGWLEGPVPPGTIVEGCG